MANQAVNAHFPELHIADAFKSFFKSISHGLELYMERKSRFAEMQALQSKTDEELAQMGIRRDKIAVHVFNDLFYI